MKAIGYATQYYTLWDYRVDEDWATNANGGHYLRGHKHIYSYIKNISKDEAKVKMLYPEIVPSMDLFGKTASWERYTPIPTLEKQKAELARKEATTFLHDNGAKVELELKEVESFGFETQFGMCYICKYISKDGNTYMYKGSTPPNIDDETYTKVKCTIKHNEYNGEKQTHIQRAKIGENNSNTSNKFREC
jgi:hypothetical protein